MNVMHWTFLAATAPADLASICKTKSKASGAPSAQAVNKYTADMPHEDARLVKIIAKSLSLRDRERRLQGQRKKTRAACAKNSTVRRLKAQNSAKP